MKFDERKMEAFRHVSRDDLTGALAEVAELLGLEQTLRLVAAHGGCEILIPAVPLAGHALAELLGEEAAATLSHRFGGERIYIASLRHLERGRRDRQIIEQHERGKSADSLARAHGITARTIRRIVGQQQTETTEEP